MSMPARAIWRTSAFLDLVFPALTVVFGLQLLRVLIPSILHVYGERANVRAIDLGVFALVTFLTAFLTPLLVRLLGLRRALWGTAGGVALLRLALQVVPDPTAKLVIATVGVIIFLFFAPTYIGYMRGAQPARNFGLALLIGLTLDAALHGAWETYDYAWLAPGVHETGISSALRGRVEAGPIVLALALAIAHAILLWRFARATEPAANSDVRFRAALPLIGLGIALYLHANFWQNIARHAATLDWPLPAAFLLVMAGNLVGLIVGVLVAVRWGEARLVTLIAATGLLAASFVAQGESAPGLILADASLAALLVQIGRSQATGDRPGLARTSSAWSIGALLFVVLVLLYYIAYEVRLPFSNTILQPIAAALVGLAAIFATRTTHATEARPIDWTPVVVGAAALIFPLAALATDSKPQPSIGDGLPLRVMSYNIRHGGFDAAGGLGPEAIARTIEASEADVIALQEVSRGWYVNASFDSLSWLSRRLNLPYVYDGTADPVWGNAILSRYPIVDSGPLPADGTPLKRRYLWAEIDVGDDRTVIVIDTHLHHVDSPDGERVRLLQLPVVIDAWDERANTIIMGDLNARPDSPVLDLAREADLLDAFDFSGGRHGPGHTFRSDDPFQRIDYILLSPDWSASEFEIVDSTASDHLGIAATVGK